MTPPDECGEEPDDHHVFTVISGFGLRVIPRAPFEARLGPGPRELDVDHFPPGDEGQKFTRVIADGEGGFKSKIAEGTEDTREVVDIEAGPEFRAWLIETGAFLAKLPRDFVLHSVPRGSASPFNLVGPGQCLIYVQTPDPVPRIPDMCGPGQRVLGQGEDWLEVGYRHEGQEWTQHHQIVGPLVFTAQALPSARGAVLRGLRTILDSLVLIDDDDDEASSTI